MVERQSEKNVGRSLPLTAMIAAIAAVTVVVAGIVLYVVLAGDGADRTVVIATGPETGTYHALGLALGRLLEAEEIVRSAEILATEGSVSNMELIGGEDGGADLAIIQSDTAANADARLIASLYDEHLHILVATPLAGQIQTIYDLRGRRVALGEARSGTRQVAQRVLDHFRVAVGEDLAITPAEVAESFLEGSIDAAFLLTAIPSTIVQKLCQQGTVRFLPLGDAQEVGNESDALALVFPSLRATTIPHSTYGRFPDYPVQSISVTAQLIASRDLDDAVVRQITETLLQQRSRIGGSDPRLAVAKRIRERYETGVSTIPYHSGAVAYYTRQQPPFLVEYAETMSLLLTLLVGLYSGYIALRQWARRLRKNRIDAYYVEALSHLEDVQTASVESLVRRREGLTALRIQAFTDLVNERLDANESFTILQDSIDSGLNTIESLIDAQSS
jgi:TRAP transporter TAXI family solute receptor